MNKCNQKQKLIFGKKKVKNKKINEKIEEIKKKYEIINSQLSKSQHEIKAKFKESLLITSSIDKKNSVVCNCSKNNSEIEKTRIKLLTTENNYLKKKIIKILNEICSTSKKEIQSNKILNKKNIKSNFELNVNQKINIPNTHKLSVNQSVKDDFESKISSVMNASFVEQSNIIGGKTFHFIAKKTASYQELEQNEKLFSGN